MESQVCPLLGLVDEQGAYLTYPSYENRCYASSPHQSIPLNEQTFFCLGGNRDRCPRLMARDAAASGESAAVDDEAAFAGATAAAFAVTSELDEDFSSASGIGDNYDWEESSQDIGEQFEADYAVPPPPPPVYPPQSGGPSRRPVWPLLLAAGTLVTVLMLCAFASASWVGWQSLSNRLALNPSVTAIVEGGGPQGVVPITKTTESGTIVLIVTPTPLPGTGETPVEPTPAESTTMVVIPTLPPTLTPFRPTPTFTWTPIVPPTQRPSATPFPTNTRVPPATATPIPPPTATWQATHEAFSMSFTANPTTINQGQESTLSWNVRGVQAIYLDGEGVSGPTGSKRVKPSSTKTYTLRVIKHNGSVQEESQTVTVNRPTPTLTPTTTPTFTPTPFYEISFAEDLDITVIDGTENSCRTGNGCPLFLIQVRNHGNRTLDYQLTKSSPDLPAGWGVFFCWASDCEFGDESPIKNLDVGARDTVSLNYRVPANLVDGNYLTTVLGTCIQCSQPDFQQTFNVQVRLPTPTPTRTATPTPTPNP
ncbi:MAG: hypothetical protein U9R25_20005 [Chloroflexota bacterium]|nr:hypothetical protein [Chloroflexota bacterium]